MLSTFERFVRKIFLVNQFVEGHCLLHPGSRTGLSHDRDRKKGILELPQFDKSNPFLPGTQLKHTVKVFEIWTDGAT